MFAVAKDTSKADDKSNETSCKTIVKALLDAGASTDLVEKVNATIVQLIIE